MKIVVDTNTFLAVSLDEPEKGWLIAVTDGHDLVAPLDITLVEQS